MTTPEDVKKLAALARIEVSDEELPVFAKEFEAIVSYVGQLDQLEISEGGEVSADRNILREDGEPTPPGTWTEKIIGQFPERDGDSLAVKQIISHD